MAIAPGLPGLQVTVTVAGEALRELDHDTVDEGQSQHEHKISKYIEAQAGADFEIATLYTPPFDPPFPVHVDIMLDGDYVQAPFAEKNDKDGCKGYRFRQATSMIEGLSHTQNFQFAELKTEEIDRPTTEATKRQASSIGQIVLYLYFIEHVEEIVPVEVPTSKPSHVDPISQKALKATVTPGDSLAYQTSLSAPKQCGSINYQQVKTTENEPFATFVFYYRSTTALKSIGLIERTPSPSPEPDPAPKNIDEMTGEELRAELFRRRNKEEQASRVKREREREDSVATVQGEDDEEVVWIGSQPKKLRKSPGDGDDVVDLGE